MGDAAATPGPDRGRRLEALMSAALAGITENRELLRQDIRQRGELTELMLNGVRLAALEEEIRSAMMCTAISAPPDAPAPGLPLMRIVKGQR